MCCLDGRPQSLLPEHSGLRSQVGKRRNRHAQFGDDLGSLPNPLYVSDSHVFSSSVVVKGEGILSVDSGVKVLTDTPPDNDKTTRSCRYQGLPLTHPNRPHRRGLWSGGPNHLNMGFSTEKKERGRGERRGKESPLVSLCRLCWGVGGVLGESYYPLF